MKTGTSEWFFVNIVVERSGESMPGGGTAVAALFYYGRLKRNLSPLPWLIFIALAGAITILSPHSGGWNKYTGDSDYQKGFGTIRKNKKI